MGIRIAVGLVACVTVGTPAFSQIWENAGVPMQYFSSPTVCYTDTVHNWLVVGAQNVIYMDSSSYMPVFRYNGMAWDTLGLFRNKVLTAVVYHDTLIVAGAFPSMKDQPIGQIACIVDGTWHPYGNFADQWGVGMVIRLRIVDDMLYALGVFENVDGQVCNGLAKRVGGHWEPVSHWADMDFVGDPWVHDIIRYQGRLVVCGNYHLQNQPWCDMLQFNGSEWLPVCDNCLHGGMDGVHEMAIYQDDLYAGGIFYYASGNAGQGIMRWNGAEWFSLGPVGDGIQNFNYSDQYSPDIGCLKVRDNLLFIGGGFRFVNHMPTPVGITTWDGTDFCILEGSPFSDYYFPFDFYNDTLYGGTGPGVSNDTLLGLVRYLSTNYTYDCSALGIDDGPEVDQALRVEWAPNGVLTLWGLKDGVHDLRVFDTQGRLVLKKQLHSMDGHSSVEASLAGSEAVYLVLVDSHLTTRVVPIR